LRAIGARVTAMPTAIIFPGQASQTPDMRDRVAVGRPDLLALVSEAVGEDPFPRVDESTRFAQPAIFCASLTGWGELEARLEDPPAALTGHSLGELAALAAAGALNEEDALQLVTTRGRLMAEAARGAAGGEGRRPETDAGGGSMLAVLGGADADALEALAKRHGVTVANDNAPGQVVLSGAREGLAAAAAEAEEQGLRAMPLNVAGAFHSPQMAAAVPEFEAALAAVDVHEPRWPVWSATTVAPFDDVRRRLAEGITRPVRWRQTVEALHAEGIEDFAETGPGTVLTKLVKRTLKAVAHV